MKNKILSISGRLAKAFISYKITPIFIVLSLALGGFALMYTPAEEDPQIPITTVDVITEFPGASASEVEMRVTIPMESILSKVNGVKHIYSTSSSGHSVVTLEYHLGEYNTESVFKAYEVIYARMDELPKGIAKPTIKAMEIDDVPSLVYSLYAPKNNYSRAELKHFAQSLKVALSQVKNIRSIDVITGVKPAMRIVLHPQKMSLLHISSVAIKNKIINANKSIHLLNDVQNSKVNEIWLGAYLESNELDTLKNLVVGYSNSAPIYLKDVTKSITLSQDIPDTYVNYVKDGVVHPSVSIAIAKEPHVSAIELEKKIAFILNKEIERYIPSDITLDMTRNYAKSAKEKVTHLTYKLLIVIAIVMILVFFTMGYRSAVIVAITTVVTLGLTLFSSMLMGFTFNQVSLFALIFAIGILVDDAIVIVENVHRHQVSSNEPLSVLIPKAVDEVGKPTIIATFAVIITLMPMAFVTGLMGPYMSPIPINASVGMLISLVVAFTIAPWLIYKFSPKNATHQEEHIGKYNIFIKANRFFLKNTFRKMMLIVGITVLVFSSFLLVTSKLVLLKMLPHDNKVEMQIVVKLPEGSSLELTQKLLNKISLDINSIPEIESQQLYAGRSGPINFNGMVRGYYLRKGLNLGEIQLSLSPKNERDITSHEIAFEVREKISKYLSQASLKIVEVPPGPPVRAAILAEVYGHDKAERDTLTSQVKQSFMETDGICDIDTKLEARHIKKIIILDAKKAERYGVTVSDINEQLKALSSETIAYIHNEHNVDSIPIILSLKDYKKSLDSLLQTKIKGIFLSEVAHIQDKEIEANIYHKDLRAVNYVSANVSKLDESPLYSMFDISANMDYVEQYLWSTPLNINGDVKWDGEWKITFETFRDMGIAYLVGLFFLYLLLVHQYNSYMMPLVMMSPIPLTIIGVLPGHYLFGASFTATSMIGMIALAGIIVRNSVLLIDFIQEEMQRGKVVEEAILESVKIRTKPILITALTAILGSMFILSDPVFEGMAISLISGIIVATFLTLLVIPVLFSLTSFYLKRENT